MTPLERTRFSSLCALTFAVTATLGAQSTSATAQSTAPTGKVEAHTVFDSTYRGPRRIWIYTPPGYDANASTVYPLIIAFDGDEYRDTMPLPMVLDTLLAAKKAPAFVAVLIDNGEGAVRIADLGNAHRMADFLAKQLVPWVQQGWRVTTDPKRVIVTGSSAVRVAHGAGQGGAAEARPVRSRRRRAGGSCHVRWRRPQLPRCEPTIP